MSEICTPCIGMQTHCKPRIATRTPHTESLATCALCTSCTTAVHCNGDGSCWRFAPRAPQRQFIASRALQHEPLAPRSLQRVHFAPPAPLLCLAMGMDRIEDLHPVHPNASLLQAAPCNTNPSPPPRPGDANTQHRVPLFLPFPSFPLPPPPPKDGSSAQSSSILSILSPSRSHFAPLQRSAHRSALSCSAWR